MPWYPKRLGHGGNLPVGTYFGGRDDTCKQITSTLISNKTAVIVAPPGYGKTSVVIEVADRMIERQNLVAYVNPQGVTCVEDLGNQIIKALGLVASEDPIRETLRCLMALESKRVVLIIENIDNLLHLDDQVSNEKCCHKTGTFFSKMHGKYKKDDFLCFLKDISQCPTAHLVLTSRETVNFGGCFASELIELQPLSGDDSATLFKKLDKSLDDESVRKLVGICGGIPLLICTTLAILRGERHSASTVNPEFVTNEARFDKYLEVYLNRLSQEKRDVLIKVSTFPYRFTQDQFLAVFKLPPVLDLQTFMNSLKHYSLVCFDRERSNYSLHPLLRDFFSLMPQHTAAKSVFICHYSNLAVTLCEEFLSREFKSAVERYRNEEENIREAIAWCGEDHPELEQTTREHCIRCFNKSAVFLAKMMRTQEFVSLLCKLSHHFRYDIHLYSSCLTYMGMKIVSSCICTPHICFRALYRAKSLLLCADKIQSSLTAFDDSTRAECLSKLGFCFVCEGSFSIGYDLFNQALKLRKERVERSMKDKDKVMFAACHNDIAGSVYSFSNPLRCIQHIKFYI